MKMTVFGMTLAVAGCGLFPGGGGGTSQTVTLNAQTTPGMQMPSGETGLATLTDLGGNTTQVALTTSGGTDTGVKAAIIAAGPCGGATAIFALLNNVVGGQQGGQSITKVNYPLSMLTGGAYSINVLNSANVSIVQTCGNIP